MRNLKRALSLTLASVMLLGMMVIGTSAAGYPDVDDSHNVEAIEVLQAVGAMSGSNSGNFNPDAKVSRVEMAIVMANLLGLDVNYFAGQNNFSDVPSWASAYVEACAANGIISGVGGGRFGTGTVTATQAALMMLKALGYFQYTEDFNNDWARATAQQAAQIRLFEGLDVANTTQLTRNQVAQLTLNALEADMVRFTGNVGTTIPTSEGPMNIGHRTEYTPRTSTDPKYNTLIDNKHTTDIIGQGQYYIQLGEELYNGKLTKSSSEDDFDRPAVTWRYDYKVIGTYVKAPDLTYTSSVKLGDIYKDLGLSKAVAAGDVDFYRNGKDESVTTSKITDNSTTPVALDTLGLSKNMANKIGGNGVLTQVWYYKDSESAVITMIDTYVGKVSTVVKATGSADRYVTLNNTTFPSISSLNNKFETEEFEVKDLVTFNAAYNDNGRYDVKGVEDLALSTTAVLNKWEGSAIVNSDKGTSNANFTAGDALYKYSLNYNVVDEDGANSSIHAFDVGKSEINIYLDKYGYAIYISGVEGEKNYAAVLGIGKVNQYGDETRGATLLLPDGSQKTVTAKMDDWSIMRGIHSGSIGSVTNGSPAYENLVTDAVADLVTYSVDENGVYKLSPIGGRQKTDSNWVYTGQYDATASNANTTFVNGKSQMTIQTGFADTSVDGTGKYNHAAGQATYYTTSETIFMVATRKNAGDASKGYNYDVYTGYANAPGIAAGADIEGISFVLDNYYGNQIEVVYIAATKMAGVSSVDTYFVKNASEHNIITTSDGKYYVLPAIVDGEETTIMIDAETKADWNGDGSVAVNETLQSAANGLYAIKSVVKNSKGIITSCSQERKSGGGSVFNAANGVAGTVVAGKVVVGIGPESNATFWAYTDATNVYYVDKDYKTIQVSSMTNVQTDPDDLVYAIHDNDANQKKLTDMIIVERQPTVTYTVNPSANVEIRSANSGWTGTATGSAQSFAEGSTVYVKAATGYKIDVSASTIALTDLGGGVYSFTAANVAANAIKAVSDGTGPAYATGVNKDAVNAANLLLTDSTKNTINGTSSTLNIVDGVSISTQIKDFVAANGYALVGNITDKGNGEYELTVTKDDMNSALKITVTKWYPVTVNGGAEAVAYIKTGTNAAVEVAKPTENAGTGLVMGSTYTAYAANNQYTVTGANNAVDIKTGYVALTNTTPGTPLTTNFDIEYIVGSAAGSASAPSYLKVGDILKVNLKAKSAVTLDNTTQAKLEIGATAPNATITLTKADGSTATFTPGTPAAGVYTFAAGDDALVQNDVITITFDAAAAADIAVALAWTDAT